MKVGYGVGPRSSCATRSPCEGDTAVRCPKEAVVMGWAGLTLLFSGVFQVAFVVFLWFSFEAQVQRQTRTPREETMETIYEAFCQDIQGNDLPPPFTALFFLTFRYLCKRRGSPAQLDLDVDGEGFVPVTRLGVTTVAGAAYAEPYFWHQATFLFFVMLPKVEYFRGFVFNGETSSAPAATSFQQALKPKPHTRAFLFSKEHVF